jgi:hypothetical protein
MDARNLNVNLQPGEAQVTASLAVGSRSDIETRAAAFAAELAGRGIPASVEVEPIVERVTGNVYAMAANEILEIHVSSVGLTDYEIAEEIRVQLEDAGFTDAMVDVELDDGQMKIAIGMECESCDPSSGPQAVRINIDGMEPPPDAQRCIKMCFETEGATDEEIEAMVHEQLRAMGIENPDDVDIMVDENGMVRVQVGDAGDWDGCCPGGASQTPKAPGEESKTWGELKKEFKE